MDKLEHSGGRVTELVNTNRLVRFFDGCDRNENRLYRRRRDIA